MITGINNTMILPDQFLTGVFGDGAELVVDVGDATLGIGDGHDGVLVEGRLLGMDLAEELVEGVGQQADRRRVDRHDADAVMDVEARRLGAASFGARGI